jgi:Flp pilus assembly protein TadG
MITSRLNSWHRSAGAAVVEFAIVAAVFFTILIGIMEAGRMLFYWNTATELTRMGARVAAVCDPNDPDIAAKIAAFHPLIPAAKVSVVYSPSPCNVNTCDEVTVSVASGVTVTNFVPFVPEAFNRLVLPEFKTTIPRESMQSTFDGTANPVCQ